MQAKNFQNFENNKLNSLPKGYTQSAKIAKEGGSVAKAARKQLESKTITKDEQKIESSMLLFEHKTIYLQKN